MKIFGSERFRRVQNACTKWIIQVSNATRSKCGLISSSESCLAKITVSDKADNCNCKYNGDQ